MSDYAEVYFYDSNNLSGNFPDLSSAHIMIHKLKGSQIVQPEEQIILVKAYYILYFST